MNSFIEISSSTYSNVSTLSMQKITLDELKTHRFIDIADIYSINVQGLFCGENEDTARTF